MSLKQQLIDQVIEAWHSLQDKAPLVQCITNSVATNYTANILLAAGASPAMIDNPLKLKHSLKLVPRLVSILGPHDGTNASDAHFCTDSTAAANALGT